MSKVIILASLLSQFHGLDHFYDLALHKSQNDSYDFYFTYYLNLLSNLPSTIKISYSLSSQGLLNRVHRLFFSSLHFDECLSILNSFDFSNEPNYDIVQFLQRACVNSNNHIKS